MHQLKLKDRMKEIPELEANGIIDEEASISISCKQKTAKISVVEFESDTGENIEEMFDFESRRKKTLTKKS